MTSETVLTDLRWDDLVTVPVDREGAPAAASIPQDHGIGLLTAYTRPELAPATATATFTVKELVERVPEHWDLTVDPEPGDPAWGALSNMPGRPGAVVGLDSAPPDPESLARVPLNRIPLTPTPIRELSLLHDAIGDAAPVYAARLGSGVAWVVVPETSSHELAERLRATFRHRPHPPILVIDQADLPARVRRRLRQT